MGHKCDGCRYKGEHQEMMFRPFGVCTKELNLIEAEKAYNADKCPYKKTNADRIRSMSDEELAIMFSESCEYRQHCFGCPAENCDCPGDEKKAWLEWLKQPAEE